MNDHQDDFDRGLVHRREVLGDDWVQRSLENANSFNAEFQELITRHAWLDIWGRPGLDHRTRRLLVLAMTLAQGRWEEFDLHVRAAVQHGLALDEIKEALLQSAIYCGVPAANTAFSRAVRVLRDLGVALAPMPLAAPWRAEVHRTFSTPQLHLLRQGQGRPVVLSHALGLDSHMWDPLASSLAGDCEVLRYDHRGHGRSAVPAGPYAMDQLVADAARVVREWGRGPVLWVGLSMGGMVGLGLAARHPELVQALVVANSTACYPPAARDAWQQRIDAVRQGGLAAVAEAVMARYFHAGFLAGQPEVAARARATLLATDPVGYLGCCHAVAAVDWRAELPGLKCPTLVLAGALDAGAPPSMSEAIAAAIPGARLELMEGASHISVLEQPAAFERLLREFMLAHGPSVSG
ncbi:bifunctional 4-carboxymuconolactone decarboxylase/3-oxoadipate enol-lactonase PcaCD [Eleftheria terrae]|uniref:bifunctional 4-carboxymuconolactone decarboxylase/3-oxoadipate enol-lactonase PcaCD n=1 Tax=Eleftheria terrae TaxID=1597781 RepID=UPI00263B154B|nr:alpha/beta fold hydrolase [Eleftheria terrae]WKB51965.1 alpha/beta fold hydrolase [Eleftheria terrae]